VETVLGENARERVGAFGKGLPQGVREWGFAFLDPPQSVGS
jgi:hypothetical protein